MSARPPPRRNDPCPCGSGRRYKECHGRLEGNARAGIDERIRRALQAHQQDRIDEAAALYREVLEREPGNAVATHYLGMVAWRRGDVAEGERLMRAAIAANASIPDFHNNLGLLLRDADRIGEAIECYRQALAANAGYFQALNNQGLALEAAGRFEGAVAAYRAAVAREPRFAAAHQNLGRLLVALGRYDEGWREYRWRLVAQGVAREPPDPAARPLAQDLSGRRLALVAEQGIGDVLFFLRFAPEAARRGAVLAFHGDPRLHPFLERAGIFAAGCRGASEPPQGEEPVFIGDLPWLLQATNPHAYPPLTLAAEAKATAAMRERVARLARPLTAITWRAGVGPTGQSGSRFKEVPLEALGRALDGVRGTWIAIQRRPRAGEVDAVSAELRAPLHDFCAANEDLEEMAALLAVVDRYVGVSNANTHLRASLRGSMEVLVPMPPEWRWGVEGNRSPWFPAMRVHRQRPGGDWSEALASLREALG